MYLTPMQNRIQSVEQAPATDVGANTSAVKKRNPAGLPTDIFRHIFSFNALHEIRLCDQISHQWHSVFMEWNKSIQHKFVEAITRQDVHAQHNLLQNRMINLIDAKPNSFPGFDQRAPIRLTLEWLIKNKGDVNAVVASGQFPPLHQAASHGWVKTGELLIKSGAKVNRLIKDTLFESFGMGFIFESNSYTPLMLAVSGETGSMTSFSEKHLAFVEMLLGKCADPNIIGAKGTTALTMALENIENYRRPEFPPKHWHMEVKCIEMLLKAGADINQSAGLSSNILTKSVELRTPLQRALRKDFRLLDIAMLFIANGAEYDWIEESNRVSELLDKKWWNTWISDMESKPIFNIE